MTDFMTRTEDLDTVHTTGFELEDVKFAFSRSIKVSVAGVEIDAKDGEMMNLPRYVAAVLEKDEHGQIQEVDMEVELKQAMVKENVQGEFELATLEDHFYIRLRAYMKKLPESEQNRLESMLNSLLRKRHGKIVHLADSSKLTAELSAQMTTEEREFYNSIHEVSSKFISQIMGED